MCCLLVTASHCALQCHSCLSVLQELLLWFMCQTLSSLLRHLKHLGMLPTHLAARSWAQLSRLLSIAVSDQSSLGNFIPAFVCADCVCHARESSDGFTCQVQQENILSFLDQVAQRLRWSICFCGLLASPCKSCDSGVLVFENRA